MKDTIFFILNGNNGATYICNANNWATLNHSLNFYKARTAKAKFLKFGLQVLLFVKGKLGVPALKTSTAVETYIQTIVKNKVVFNIDTACSILISPAKDKVIVNHHNNYFEKFAFGKSYTNVKREAAVYNLFGSEQKHFQVSRFYDANFVDNNYCKFKLSNKNILTANATKEIALAPILIEFFNVSKRTTTTIKTYSNQLQQSIKTLGSSVYAPQLELLEIFKNDFGTCVFPLGLVHRDFKPWNVLPYDKVLIYDFEETIVNGLPLEDLLNYYIDPIIRFKSSTEVVAFINTIKSLLKTYLKELEITIDLTVFLQFYCMERLIFHSKENDKSTSNKYKDLSNLIIKERI